MDTLSIIGWIIFAPIAIVITIGAIIISLFCCLVIVTYLLLGLMHFLSWFGIGEAVTDKGNGRVRPSPPRPNQFRDAKKKPLG